MNQKEEGGALDKRTAENLRVKKAIVEAFLQLLKKYPNDKISITMITERAGVSRMAYYRNFDSKNDILLCFLEEVFEEIKSQMSEGCRFWSREYGYVFLKVMRKYKDQFLLLEDAGFIGMVQTMFNDANLELAGDMPYNSVERYHLFFASGASLNGIMEWFRNDCRESMDEFFRVLTDFLGENII